jgi:hypothetical protein
MLLVNYKYTKMFKIDNDYCGVVRTYHDDAKTELYEEYFVNA